MSGLLLGALCGLALGVVLWAVVGDWLDPRTYTRKRFLRELLTGRLHR